MSDIEINKGLIILALGLLIALAAAVYVVTPNDGNAQQAQYTVQTTNPVSAQPAALAQAKSGGCGCGGGGQTAPDPSKAVLVNASSADASA